MLSKPTASVIVFHGAGDTGAGIRNWITSLLGRNFRGSHIRYVFPTAPEQQYTPYNGEISNVWFDRDSVSRQAAENRESMSRAYQIAKRLIGWEVAAGIPLQRIIVGGFSMGGALALHTAYHLQRELGGVFAHSAYLNGNSIVYRTLENVTKEKLPSMLMIHGTDDDVVEFDWGLETYQKLQELGVTGSFMTLEHSKHELTESSLEYIEQWLLKKLP